MATMRYTRPTRRALGRVAAVTGIGAVFAAVGLDLRKLSRPKHGGVAAERKMSGSTDWMIIDGVTRAADDIGMQIKGYASSTSVVPGDQIAFHVTVADAEKYHVQIYRLGWYGGAGARRIVSSPKLAGVKQAAPDLDAETGMISCDWEPSWSVRVGSWAAGYHLAVFTTDSGWRSYAPFVVHDPAQRGGLCVVLPFSTYQAYNQWPLDGVIGKSLYYGYDADAKRVFDKRAYRVSFDRPYSGDGQPKLFSDDLTFVQWAEKSGFNLNYATTIDIESGRLSHAAYTGFVFPGHDEYWSPTMRQWAEGAVDAGRSLAFLGANNVYWKVLFGASADGRPNRVVSCYKTGIDPIIVGSATMRWRDSGVGPNEPEQAFLGIQYNGIVKGTAPLIVQSPDHWFWDGCDVIEGAAISKLVGIESDGVDPAVATPHTGKQTILAASPYKSTYGGTLTQNTSILEHENGSLVFVAGTLHWTKGLAAEGFVNRRITRATKNLLKRMQATATNRPTGSS